MLPTVMLALCMQMGGSPQTQKPKVEKPVVSSRQSRTSRSKSTASRGKSKRDNWNVAQATCFTVAENGRSTANNERCFSNGPEYMCALPTNLNPTSKYCQHKRGLCRPISVLTKSGEIISVHVVDHCPHSGVIDFNPAAANKIFLNKDSSKQDWWSRAKVEWSRP